MWRTIPSGIVRPCLSSALYRKNRRYYSADETRFRIYPRSFPFDMLNVMNHGKRVLKVEESEDISPHNIVRIEDSGLIDPYIEFAEAGPLTIEKH